MTDLSNNIPQKQPKQNDLVDPSDFCRICRGTGRTYSEETRENNRKVSVASACWQCHGTGQRTVLVGVDHV